MNLTPTSARSSTRNATDIQEDATLECATWIASSISGKRVLFMTLAARDEAAFAARFLLDEGFDVSHSSSSASSGEVSSQSGATQSWERKLSGASSSELFGTIVIDENTLLKEGARSALKRLRGILEPTGTVLAILRFDRLLSDSLDSAGEKSAFLDFITAVPEHFSLTSAHFVGVELCCVLKTGHPSAKSTTASPADIARYLEFALALVSQRYLEQRERSSDAIARISALLTNLQNALGLSTDRLPAHIRSLSDIENTLRLALTGAKRLAYEASFSHQGLQLLSRWSKTQVIDSAELSSASGGGVKSPKNASSKEIDALHAELERLRRHNHDLKAQLVALHGTSLVRLPFLIAVRRWLKTRLGQHPYSPIQAEVEVVSRINAGNTAGAISWIETAILQNWADKLRLYQIAYDALKRVDLVSAVRYGEMALELDPSNTKLHSDLMKKKRRLESANADGI